MSGARQQLFKPPISQAKSVSQSISMGKKGKQKVQAVREEEEEEDDQGFAGLGAYMRVFSV